MKVLILGGYGLLGCRIGEYLSQNYEVTLATRSIKKEKEKFINYQHQTISIDWDDNFNVKDQLRPHDVIVHCAGMNSFDSFKNPTQSMQFKYNSTFKIIDSIANKSNKTFIYISSAHVYSKDQIGTFNEEAELLNQHPYALALKAGEKLICKNSYENLSRSIILRCSNGFGAPVIPDTDCWNLFTNNVCKQSLNENFITIENPDHFRDFVPIQEISRLIEYIIKSKISNKSIFNFGSGVSRTTRDQSELIIERISKIFNKKVQIENKKQNSYNSSSSYKYDSSKIINNGFKREDNYFYEIDRLLHYVRDHNIK